MLVLYLLIAVLILGISGCVVSQWMVQVNREVKPNATRKGESFRTGAEIKGELDTLLWQYQDGKLSEEQFQNLTNELIDELVGSLTTGISYQYSAQTEGTINPIFNYPNENE